MPTIEKIKACIHKWNTRIAQALMDIRKTFIVLRAISAFAVVAALAFPCAAEAVSIGEAVLQSRVGEPLLAQVDVTAGSNERIEDSCLSLAAHEPLQGNAVSFLTEAKLSIKTDGARQYVNISSLQPFNNSHIRFRLQVKCPGMQGVIKTLTIPSPAQTADMKQGRSAFITPEYSEKSRIGNINAEELALMLEQQKLLVASFMAMQQQIKLLQDELRGIKLQLAQWGSGPSSAALATAGTQGISTGSDKQPAAQQGSSYLQNILLSALGLAVSILVLWFGLRYRNKMKSHIGTDTQQETTHILKPAGDAAAQKIPVSSAIKQPSQIKSAHAPSVDLSAKAGAAMNAVAPLHPPAKTIDEKAAEADSMLEEARLYVANGRLIKAGEILLDIIKRYPSKADAWTLLLSIYSSLGKAADFEKAAREFLKHHKASTSWSGIQALGRTLDHDNPLYADHGGHIAASPLSPDARTLHHPIGDILIETGVLSNREIAKYLDDFDPKKHGRFGGYLVARKAITIAQLDQALLQQQGVHTEAKHGGLPSLKEIESFLANFDPKKHGSVSKFMALHNVTPEQLNRLLQQKSKQGEAAKNTQTGDTPHFDRIPAL
jgi:tetratricopeptide (TPR) repeat protein